MREVNDIFSLPWFFVVDLPGQGETAELDAEQARHAGSVLRLKDGAEIGLFDGRGQVARAEIASGKARGKELSARVAELMTLPPPRPAIHLAAALPKGDRQAVMLAMATQWGIASFTPLDCEHSVVAPGRGFRDRCLRVCLEACKQCRRAHVPEIIEQAVDPVGLTSDAAARGQFVLLAHPGETPLREIPPPRDEVLVLIGPEAGFTDAEASAIVAAGARMASLGDTLLRLETAAVSVIAWLRLAGA